VFGRCGRDLDQAEHRRLPRIQLGHVANANLARPLAGPALDRQRDRLVRVRREGVDLVMIVMAVTDQDAG
jgi:hypothetical protein